METANRQLGRTALHDVRRRTTTRDPLAPTHAASTPRAQVTPGHSARIRAAARAARGGPRPLPHLAPLRIVASPLAQHPASPLRPIAQRRPPKVPAPCDPMPCVPRYATVRCARLCARQRTLRPRRRPVYLYPPSTHPSRALRRNASRLPVTTACGNGSIASTARRSDSVPLLNLTSRTRAAKRDPPLEVSSPDVSIAFRVPRRLDSGPLTRAC